MRKRNYCNRDSDHFLRLTKRRKNGRCPYLFLMICALVLWCPGAPSNIAVAETAVSERISLDLKGIDIIELFKILSLKTGLTIVPQAGVKGRVNLFLNNVRFNDVLDIILINNNLASERIGSIISIMTTDQYYGLYGKRYEEKRKVKSFKLNYAKPVDIFNTLSQLKSDIGKIIVDESSATVVLVDVPEKIDFMEEMVKQLDQPPQTTEVMSLNYAKAKDLEPQVSKIITAGAGEVAVDERTNKLMVTDLPEKMRRIKRMVRAFDEESTQVLIAAEIVELTVTEQYQQGIDWERIFTGLDNLDFKGKFSLSLDSSGSGNRQEINVGTVSSDHYNAILQMLKTYGRTSVLSQPRIACVNNQEGKILVGAREAYITQTLSTAETATTTAENIEYVDVGVKLNVTPTISKDGFVTMKIKPEISSVREYLTTSLGSRVPIVVTSEAETVVRVKDGAMVMIAGLSKKNEPKTENRVPILSRIPLVGIFFGNKTIGTSSSPKNSELIVFITPKIITGDVPVPKELVSSEVKLEKPIKGFKDEYK